MRLRKISPGSNVSLYCFQELCTERNDFVIGTNQGKANAIFVKKRCICYDYKLIRQCSTQSIVSLVNKRLICIYIYIYIYIYIKVADGCRVSNRKKLTNFSQVFSLY